MKTSIANIIPSLQRYSQQLDNLTLLTDKHWVVIDEIDVAKNVYIFRKNGQLLISQNGKVEKASWEYLGNNSILIDRSQDSYLFRHGFFDENVLALKVDGKEEYAFMVNENKYEGEINSFDRVIDFLRRTYVDNSERKSISTITNISLNSTSTNSAKPYTPHESYNTLQGELSLEPGIAIGNNAYLNNRPAPDGKYKIGFLYYIWVEKALISNVTFT